MKFITYFDYLGFGEFIRNNDQPYQNRVLGNIFRDMESALARGKLKEAPHGVIADFSETRVHCINFSDTVIYWTNDTTVESLKELMDVTHRFTWQTNLYFFPARGSIVIGEMERIDYSSTSEVGGTYNLNSVFGKGLVRAHEIAEKQYWAGTILDSGVFDFIMKNVENPEDYLKKYTKSYNVPLKDDKFVEMNAFHLTDGAGINDEAFKNLSNGIRENWANHNKSVVHPSVKAKLDNTLEFLESYKNGKPNDK